jgi:peptide/nickel transport system permease protein
MEDGMLDEQELAAEPAASPTRARRRLRSPVEVTAGVVILVLLLLLSFMVGWIRPFGPNEVVAAPFSAPDATHWLGTDAVGRDYFVRLAVAGRTSLTIALLSSVLAMVVGSLIGLASGYWGGWLDSLFMGAVDLLLSFPSILLALAAVTAFSPTQKTLIIVLAFISVPHFARVVRARCLELREREFVLSARVSGVAGPFILGRHLLPNVASLVMVQVANTAAIVILIEASLSYLGLGVQPPTPSWGRMIFESQNYMSEFLWLPLGPFAALLLSSVGWGLIGEGFSTSRRSLM